jgi:hypothetical protein
MAASSSPTITVDPRSEDVLRVHKRAPPYQSMTNNALKHHAHILRLSGLLRARSTPPQGSRSQQAAQFLQIIPRNPFYRRHRFQLLHRSRADLRTCCLSLYPSAARRTASRSVLAGRRKVPLTQAVIASRSFSLVVSTLRIGPRWIGYACSLRATSSRR